MINEWVHGFLACTVIMAAFGGLAALVWAVRRGKA